MPSSTARKLVMSSLAAAASRLATLKANVAWLCEPVAAVCWRNRVRNLPRLADVDGLLPLMPQQVDAGHVGNSRMASDAMARTRQQLLQQCQ
jgi:hypothetical protein